MKRNEEYSKVERIAIVLTEQEDVSQAGCLLSAAKNIEDAHIECWVFGEAKELQELDVHVVIELSEAGSDAAEGYLQPLFELCEQRRVHMLLFSGSMLNNAIVSRLSVRMEGCSALDIVSLEETNAGVCISRQVFGYHLQGVFLCHGLPAFFSVAYNAFVEWNGKGQPKCCKKEVAFEKADYFLDEQFLKEEEEVGLEYCPVVLCAGLGIESKQNMQKLCLLAEKMHAGIGATRPVVLNAWVPMEHLVGVSGQHICPELLFVFGASGCSPFTKGIEKSRIIVAVNTNRDASIFKFCDFGLCEDCGEVIEQLLKKESGTENVIHNNSKKNKEIKK